MLEEDYDWKRYPELSNKDLSESGFTSPHVQIEADFDAVVVKVHDGDTVTLRCDFRDFDFPLRFASVDAPELNTGVPGEEARDFVVGLCLGEFVTVRVDRFNRVGKYGRLLGDVVVGGLSVSGALLQSGFALPFARRGEGLIPDLNKTLRAEQWF